MKELFKYKIKELLNRATKLQGIAANEDKVYWLGQVNILKVILSFIDSMQKEPVSEGLEEEIKQYCIYHGYLDSLEDCGYTFNEQVGDIACHFANWQKEQMMKDAVEARFTLLDGFCIDRELYKNYEVGEKYKLIVIKED